MTSRRSASVGRRVTVGTVGRAATLALTASIAFAYMAPTASASPTDAPQALGLESASRPGGDFSSPDMDDRPLYRFWNTGGLMTPASVKAQVQQIKASGAGGFEANQLTQVVQSAAGYDPATMSWGTPAWTKASTALLTEGEAAGLRVDQIYTPGWSASTQTVSPDGRGSAKEITLDSSWLSAGQTFDGPLPTSPLPDGVTKRELQGVLAYRCVSTCDGAGAAIPVLDPGSAVDLTGKVANGAVAWAAPAEPVGVRYVVVAAWMHGTGQKVALAATPKPSFLVDHFNAAGFDAVRDYWETKVLTPQLRTAMRNSGGSLFFDSLELNREGHQVRFWTPDMLAEFKQRRGYSLVPYLPAVAVTDPVFEFTTDLDDRIREDYNQTLSDLFLDTHLKPLKAWGASLGLTVRGQAYSSWGPSPIDPADMAAVLDIPEGEDLSFNAGLTEGQAKFITTRGSDTWRSLASARAQTGGNRISTECCATLGANAVERQLLLAHVNQQFSVGVNQVVWHGWADQSPGAASSWPGFSPFGSFVSDVYGPQNPTFADDAKINTYVGRMQQVLRRGNLHNDVAIYRDDRGHSVAGNTADPYFTDQSLARSGFTYGFMNNTLVNSPTATVTRGVLNANGLGYKAFVLNNTKNANTNPTLDLATAKRVLGWAKAGLPIIVVGDLPDRVRGNHPEQDAELRASNNQLLAHAKVIKVATEDQVLGALRKVGVRSAAQYAEPAPLVTLHRQTSDSDYYYLFNSGAGSAVTTVSLQGRGRPYAYNAWTGAVTPIAEYTRSGDRVTVDVDLESGDGALIAVTPGNSDTPRSCAISAVSTTADEVRATDRGTLVVRDSEAGGYTTRLNTGRKVTSHISRVPGKLTPADWTLNVTSWEPGAGPNDSNKVAKDPIALRPGAEGRLPDWQTIPGLRLTSGTAVYTTTVDVGPAWTGGTGAYLDLGDVRGLAWVSVNGQTVPTVDQIDRNGIDIGHFLNPGSNLIDVHLSTLLGNAAYKGVPSGLKSYGLVGPVQLRPYGQVAVTNTCGR